MAKNSKTFCILPFIHIQVKPNGQIKPCCRFDFVHDDYINKDWNPTQDNNYHTFNRFNVSNGSTLTEAMTSYLWEDIRQRMLNGEKVSGCRKCYAEEALHDRSMRINENYLRNNNIQDNISNEIVPLKIKYLEMTFGNYCNLKCRTCAGDLSSTWHDEEIQIANLYPGRFSAPKVLNIPFNWKPKDFINVEEIKFTGGEPMIHPDFIKLMDMLIDIDISKNISLDVFTNCSWNPGQKFLDRLKEFKQVKISLSVDGVGVTNDYIRTPSKWEIVDNVVDKWLQQEFENTYDIQIAWNPTINIYNILEIDKMIEWWDMKQNSHFPNRRWPNLENKHSEGINNISSFKMIFNILQDPKYLSIANLPTSMKCIVNEKIKSIHTKYHTSNNDRSSRKESFIKKLEAIRSTVNSPPDPDMLAMFGDYTADLDNLRNQSFKDALPNLYAGLRNFVDFEGRL
jgi:hypothetical protein